MRTAADDIRLMEFAVRIATGFGHHESASMVADAVCPSPVC
jgi:hypothetical protein